MNYLKPYGNIQVHEILAIIIDELFITIWEHTSKYKKKRGRWARFSSIWNLGKGITLMFNFCIL
jgi:hypothetical protein